MMLRVQIDTTGPEAESRPVSSVAEESNEPIAVLRRFAFGEPSLADIELMRKGVMGYINCEGEVPLERCLGLPHTPNGRRIEQRNRRLMELAQLIEGDKPWAGCGVIEDMWSAFVSRGVWRTWQAFDQPPAGATAIEVALFYATRNNNEVVLNQRQIFRICRHIFKPKSQRVFDIVQESAGAVSGFTKEKEDGYF
ncbi:MAG: hypothetical protein Q8R06_09690 [Polaromonas sp.]|uniref:hypothetical protein n=1 Tax=Polaromonas sp. TaxID=1869339 RepID=UPI00273434E3|nr:hypothetical protein [Polaromonas sp.]MDP3797407.1 hypothetical protein [Polaromonas sp.]